MGISSFYLFCVISFIAMKHYCFTTSLKRPYTIIISNHTAEAYSSKCRVNSSFGDLRSPRFLDLNVELLTIIRNPFMHTELYFESDNGKFDMEVVNRTVDLCKFYKNKKYEPVVQVVFKLLEDYLTHWFSSCPMNKVCFEIFI